MGAFLDKPNVEKENGSGEGHSIKYALASMQGWRAEMEDAHIATLDMEPLPEHGFFAVFDGHGGKTVSTQCGSQFVNVMLSSETFKQGDKSMDHLKTSLYDAHFAMDEYLKEKFPGLVTGGDRSGSTAVMAFVTPTHIIISNCGDSRAVLCSEGKVRFASDDHKPTNAVETNRIVQAQGQVVLGRVNGNLAVSRALGDFVYKDVPSLPAAQQKVSPEPDMTVLERNDKDEFLVLACDGIFDVMTNDALYTFVSNQLRAGYTPTETCNRLLDYCLALNSRDNMSAVLVVLPGAPQKEEGFKAPENIPDPHETQRETASPVQDVSSLQALLGAMGFTVDTEDGPMGLGERHADEEDEDEDDEDEDEEDEDDSEEEGDDKHVPKGDASEEQQTSEQGHGEDGEGDEEFHDAEDAPTTPSEDTNAQASEQTPASTDEQ
eukprot:m.17641 g.17641  ORF g.17641 m.17641 type:complete len:434 (-) comp8330_c0_seq1:353-1654(-)